MSTFAPKLAAARNSSAWQLALDKFPYNLGRSTSPSLTAPDDKGKEQSIKPQRLREIKDRAAAAAPEWKAAVASRLTFLDTLEKQHGQRFRSVTLVNSSRLLLHLGRASVLENVGLYCDRTTGLPIIPGTAVKGVVSTWACWEGNQDRESFSSARSELEGSIAKVLGTNPDKEHPGDHIAGTVTFIGGIPSILPKLELDIVTPHPDDGKGRITPNPFLAIAAGTIWRFPLISSSRLTTQEASDALTTAASWLEQVLTELGMGAKTAAGFGGFRILNEKEKAEEASRLAARMKAREEADEAVKKAQELAKASPEEQAYLTYIANVADWTASARDILKTVEPTRGYILRYFRSDVGRKIIKDWPNNDKAKQRKADLKEAGL